MTTAQRRVLDAARAVVAGITQGDAPGDAALSAVLDRLLATFHDAPQETVMFGDSAMPAREFPDYQARYNAIGARFPDYGYYAIADSLDLSGNALMTGDAIDDLVDIAHDLENALWIGQHQGDNAAISHLDNLYFHWAGHARELLGYLHARQFG